MNETLATTAEEYLALDQEERVELLKKGRLDMVEFKKLNQVEQVECLNNRLKAKGQFYDNGGIFGRSGDVTSIGVLSGVQAAMADDQD